MRGFSLTNRSRKLLRSKYLPYRQKAIRLAMEELGLPENHTGVLELARKIMERNIEEMLQLVMEKNRDMSIEDREDVKVKIRTYLSP